VAIHVDDKIVYINQKLVSMLGYKEPAELLGGLASNLVQESRRAISKEMENTMLITDEEQFTIEDVYERENGQLLPVEVSAMPIEYQGENAVQIIARDISERKKIEAEIWEYQNMLKQHSSDLVLAEEAERRNLAIILHDHLGQNLAMAKIKMTSVLNDLEEGELREKLQAIERDISGAVKQTRSLTYELSPPVLHELGLITALEWRLDKFSEETGIITRYEHNIDQVELRDEQAIILFRSTDEILKNIIKYAQTETIEVFVNASRNSFVVQIQDHGQGFDTAILAPQNRKNDSFGLFSIKERLEYLGGVLDIQSDNATGTLVTLNIPVSLDGF
jgi:PAS domain S-box-containing protein